MLTSGWPPSSCLLFLFVEGVCGHARAQCTRQQPPRLVPGHEAARMAWAGSSGGVETGSANGRPLDSYYSGSSPPA